MEFFTSPEDLNGWVKSQGSADEAAHKIIDIIGVNDEQDVIDTCKAIFDSEENSEATQVLFGTLAKSDLVRQITSSAQMGKLIKEAQSQRTGLYNDMEKRVCPKLPRRSSIISTWNCREHCLDSMILDDDPNRVYCKEALWRRHVMDKFSRDFKDKDGKLVGGYINERFQVMKDDGGNQMELANGERTRKPRPHQYSTERRLEEARGEKTTDITASINDSKIVKLASYSGCSKDDEKIHSVFSDIVDMTEAGMSYENILTKVSEHYDMSITSVAQVHKVAMSKFRMHAGTKYAYSNPSSIKKTSGLASGTPMIAVDLIQVRNGNPVQPNTRLQVIDERSGSYLLPNGQQIALANPLDASKLIDADVQSGADEVGLSEDMSNVEPTKPDYNIDEAPEDFAIKDV